MSRRAHHIPSQEILLSDLRLGRPKKGTTQAELKIMMADLVAHGLRAPLVVAPATGGGYDVVDGCVRVLAAKRIGWKKLLCAVLPEGRPWSAQKDLADIITKLALGTLADHELARKAIDLRDDHHIPAAGLADILGRSRGYTCNLVRWWESAPDVVRRAWQEKNPLINQGELERLSQMSKETSAKEWKRKLVMASHDDDGAWMPKGKSDGRRNGARPASTRVILARNVAARAQSRKLDKLGGKIAASKLRPPVKMFVQRVLGFLAGKVKSIPGVTDHKRGIPKEIRA